MNLYFTIMKKYLLWICTAAALLSVGASCADDPEVDGVGRVGLQQQSLTADGAGEELTLNVTSNAYWHIEFADHETGDAIRWVSASEVNGMGNSAVTLTVARNRSTNGRTAHVNVVTDSESDSASILLSQGSGTIGGGEGYDFPFYQMFGIDASLALDNAFIEGSTCYFDNGMILRRTGSPVTLEFSTQTHTNPKSDWYFQRGIIIGSWATDDALVLEIPLKEELSGDLRYSYGSRRDGTQSAGHAWAFEWSADGENWIIFDGTSSGGASDAVWKVIDFTIPADKKIPAGGKLWIRHRCLDGAKASTSSNPTVTYQTGFCITRTSAEPTSVPAMNDETVVFSTGFDDVIDAKAAYIDLPLDFMSSWNDGAYALPQEQIGIVSLTSCWTRPGFLQVGRGDEAVITRYTQGAYTICLTSRFEKMNISKTDLKLTFLASAMIDAYGKPTDPGVVVKVDDTSGAAVEGSQLEGVANNEFKPFTVYVRNAKPETEITITSAEMTSGTDDVRFYLDDILLQVEGEPERPDADDPVKSDIRAIRALKGTSPVTIADNLYIQGRVISVDNVPEGSFAMQDTDAGIFVKLADHSFAAGDLVEVVVKGAALATDADGLLVITPKTVDRVTKVEGASEVPAYRTISVAELQAGTCEAMLVSLPESQVVEADLAKNLSGDITLELEDRLTTYTLKTYAWASFASTAVPQLRGAVKGLAGASSLLPASVGDLAAMTGTRFGEAVYAITPIDGMLKMAGDPLSYIYNATYDNAAMTVTYTDNGCTITKLGNTDIAGSGLTNKATPYDGRFTTTGWGGGKWEENALLFRIKATSRIVGNLRFGFGLFAASSTPVPHNYKLEWSADNTTWNSDMDVREGPYTDTEAGNNEFSIPGSANSGGYKMAIFNIPDSKAVAEGGYLYIRIRQADNTTCHKSGATISTDGQLQFEHAFYLATHEKRAYHTNKLPSGENVVFTYGFDEAFYGHDYFIPTWQMSASKNAPNKYTAPEGWAVDAQGYVYELPGYIRLGLDDKASGAGSITTPALEALGDTPADITLSFKIGIHLGGSSSYKPDPTTLTVTAEGAGSAAEPVHELASLPAECTPATEAEAKAMENAYHNWHDVTVKITGATKATRITIGGTGRHYIDDIVITKD